MSINNTQQLPQNLEAEASVLGALMLDADSLLVASDVITAGDFYKSGHGLIFNACLDTYHDTGTLDFISVYERLKATGQVDAAGGLGYLSNLANTTPTAANIRYHAKIVKHNAMLRRTLRWLQEKFHETQAGPDDLCELYSSLEQGVIELSQSVVERKSPDIKAILGTIRQRWTDEQNGLADYISTSEKLYRIIPRYSPGNFWMVGGYTSVGKSTFMAQMMVDALEAGAKVAVFSLEDSSEDKALKLIANLADTDQRRLMTGNLSGIEDRIREATLTMENWPIRIYDDCWSVAEMRLKMKKMKMTDGLNMVFIDYIQNIKGDGNLYDRLSTAAPTLLEVAKELQITIIAASQISNDAAKGKSGILELKGAGELAAAADIVISLKREKSKGKEKFLNCEIGKNRSFGETGTLALKFSESWSRIESREMTF